MRSTNFNEGSDLEVFSLHNSCRDGDHYLAHQDDLFYIIKGNNYRHVTNLHEDTKAVVYSLHPKCREGDHYLSASGHFYIIFQSKGIYRKVTNLNTDGDTAEYTLHPECRNGLLLLLALSWPLGGVYPGASRLLWVPVDGLYYWGIKDYYYFVKPQDEWGTQYYRCSNFHENIDAVTYSFHGSVVSFLPGGLAINQDAAFGKWDTLKTISDDSNTPIIWNTKIMKKVGYNKQKMSSVEHNWKISMGATYQTGDLAAAIVKYQLSLSSEFGGASVNTQQEDWSEATEVKESIHVTLQPQTQLYIWQYQLGLGKEPVLFLHDSKPTNNSTPPTTIPLPPSKK